MILRLRAVAGSVGSEDGTVEPTAPVPTALDSLGRSRVFTAGQDDRGDMRLAKRLECPLPSRAE